ncbi:13254_t:CDS:2, partial [Cetraspora pellucida]
MASKKDQLKNIINLVKIAELNDDQDAMNIDQNTEFDEHLALYYKILNSEIDYNKIPKSYNWVQNCLFNYRDKEFRKTLRMDKETFWILVDKIKFHPVFYSNSNNNQTDIAIQLAVVLYRLGSNASLWTIAVLFEKCEQTILNFLDRLIIAIRSLKDEYIVGFPIVIGAIDGSHIPLMEASSKINKDIYMSHKHRYGIHLQAIIDHKGYFTCYEIGWPASVHDAKVFKHSYIYKNNNLFIETEDYLLGDPAYPLLSWIITPFKDPQGSNAQQQKYYNTCHSKTRVIVEQAFGKLKARFSFLKNMRLKDTKKNNDEWEENDNNDEIDDSELIYEFDEDEDLISRNNAKIKQQNLLEII